MYRTILLFLALGTLPATAADPKFDADAAMKKLAPFIDGNTFLVAHVDLQRMNAADLVKLAAPMFIGDAPPEMAPHVVIGAFQKALIQKGVRELYVVYGATDFPHKPCLLVPIGESPPERKDLYELLKTGYAPEETAWANINGFLCVGAKIGLDGLRARKPSERPDIAEALAACGNAPCQVLFAPSAETRKVFEEVAPNLPKELGGDSILTFTRGLKWVGLSLGPTLKAEMRLVIKCADEQAAQKLESIFVKTLEQGKNLVDTADGRDRAAYLKFYNRAVQLLTPRVEKDQLVISHELAAVLPEVAKMVKEAQPEGRSISSNNLKQLGLAMHNYLDANGRFPTDIKSTDGKPLLSWRVAILPYVEQSDLYQEFKLDEPWDSEHNKTLIARMPKIYRSPRQGDELKDRTTYLAPLGNGLMWDDPKGVRIADVTDGTSCTILLVESDDEHAVVWSKPDDIVIDKKNPTKGLLGHWDDGFLTLWADASVRFVSKNYSAIWAMFTKAGGEALPEK